MIVKQIIKNIFFLLHFIFILVSIFVSFFYWQVLILQLMAIISWQINNKKCILTQIEDYLFNESIIDCYFKLTDNNKKYTKFVVPKYQRYLVYFLFITTSLYWLIIKN
jgi:hypothetical protein